LSLKDISPNFFRASFDSRLERRINWSASGNRLAEDFEISGCFSAHGSIIRHFTPSVNKWKYRLGRRFGSDCPDSLRFLPRLTRKFERFTFKTGELARLRRLGRAYRRFGIWLQGVIFQYLTPNRENSFPAFWHLAPGLLLTTFEKQTVKH
jgi:hypothetical protein